MPVLRAMCVREHVMHWAGSVWGDKGVDVVEESEPFVKALLNILRVG